MLSALHSARSSSIACIYVQYTQCLHFLIYSTGINRKVITFIVVDKTVPPGKETDISSQVDIGTACYRL